ncbi:MAG: amidase [Myxococcales bacterium]|nr:amidase [Myxococcales bacterium]
MSHKKTNNNLYAQPVTRLVDMLESHETTSVTILETLFARIDVTQPQINALTHQFRTEALAFAKMADDARRSGQALGPLHGIPITVKESIATEHVGVTLGLPSRKGHPVKKDAVVVHLAKSAGAILLGKTNVPQLLLAHETDNPVYGRTQNPWNLDRGPGGSSGGEAAAIASGQSYWGIGTDIGGSIRVPCAFTGIAGLKPTVDRWSNIGCHTALMGQETIRAQCGPMARTAEDVTMLFLALSPTLHAEHDPAVAPLPVDDPFTIEMEDLRIGYYDTDSYLTPSASVRRAVSQAVRRLERLGAKIIEFRPPHAAEIIELYYAALSADGVETIDLALKGNPVIPQVQALRRVAGLPSPVRALVAKGLAWQGEHRAGALVKAVRQKSVADLWSIAARRNAIRLSVLQAWDQAKIDAMVCPAFATPAIRHMQGGEFTVGGGYSMRYNFLNFPAGVVPVTRVKEDETERLEPQDRFDRIAKEVDRDSAGLPIGVQVVARPYREDLVLAVMMAIEAECRGSADFPHTPVEP